MTTFIVILVVAMLIVNGIDENWQWKSTKINVYKRGIGIVNDDHHQDGNQRRSSSRKSSTGGMNINMGNVNHQQWSSPNGNRHIVGGMLVCQCRVHKSGVSNPSMTRPRPFVYLSKNIYKIYEPPVPPTVKHGGGGIKMVGDLDERHYLHICITEHEDDLRHGNRTVISNSE